MIVLDYPKITKDMSIVVPPFHTGHLGLLPDTPVTVGLMAPFVADSTSCELVITPYDKSPENMAILTCTLQDDIGVVQRLIDAISSLDINIVTQESTVLNHLNNHFVNLLLDLSTSYLRQSPTYQSVIRHYNEYEALFPIHDFRYVQIFESVVAHCADVIEWRDISGVQIPQLQIRPLIKQQFKHVDDAIVRRDENAPYHIKISLPKTITTLLRRYLRVTNDQPLTYLLVSDTNGRTLRAFFPTEKVADKFVHIGFYHDDVPGVLSALLRTLASAQFNIVASLLRRHETERNVWEAILEYRGKSRLPNRASGEKLCIWIANNLSTNCDNPLELEKCNIDIGLPLYPRVRAAWTGKIRLNEYLQTRGAHTLHHEEIEKLLTRRENATTQNIIDLDRKNHILDLISKVRWRIIKRDKPTVFLSYPIVAERHAKLIKKKLQQRYQFVDYVRPDGEIILDEVIQRITNCTYFIGIWHHEESLPTVGGKYNVSPWMPFEYGVAIMAQKPTIVIHSEKLDERVWKRINAGVSHPEYSDIYFSHTLEMLDEYCTKHMK